MTPGESAALTVAIIALVVSVFAAGFAGWEAVTAHLNRTRPRPAAWAISYDKSDGTWVLHNVGGSAASFIRIKVGMSLARERGNPDPFRSTTVEATLHPGASEKVAWGHRMFDPRSLFVPAESGNWRPLQEGEESPDARYITDREAEITWRDYSGRERRGSVALR